MPTEGNNSGDQNQNDKVTFTPEQQARIDEIVREAMGRAGREAKTALDASNARLTTLESELAEAKKVAAKAKGSEEKKEAKAEVEQLQAQIDEMKRAGSGSAEEIVRLKKLLSDKDREVSDARGETSKIRKENAISAAASKVGFVDLKMVTKLTSDDISYDEAKGRFVVVNEDGTHRMNSAYEAMNLDEFFAEFASKNPFLVRGDVRGGVGSTESKKSGLSNNGKYAVEDIFGPKADPVKANALAMSDKKEYRRLKEIAREQKLISF